MVPLGPPTHAEVTLDEGQKAARLIMVGDKRPQPVRACPPSRGCTMSLAPLDRGRRI